jgi:hypothetical protein
MSVKTKGPMFLGVWLLPKTCWSPAVRRLAGRQGTVCLSQITLHFTARVNSEFLPLASRTVYYRRVLCGAIFEEEEEEEGR